MRQLRAGTALALALGLGVGCSSAVKPEVLQAWVGRPAAALRQEWGPPTREVEDGALRILIYEQIERRSGADFQSPSATRATRGSVTAAEAAASEASRNPTVYVRSYLFWVNPEGTIVQSDARQP